MTTSETCPCCDGPLHPGLASWHRACAACGYEAAKLQPAINDRAAHAELDEAQRDAGLRTLREQNFRQLLDRLVPMLHGERVLDVGAAHGWFVRLARERRLQAEGLEPDEQVCARAQRSGLPLRAGFFPQALGADERFDAIVFNDVFEHIPPAAAILAACREHLHDDGCVVINLPSSRGVFYRTAKLLKRLGIAGPFDRMWQKDLPSPHVHYFHADNLAAFGARHGFEAVARFHLPSVRVEGLYARIASVRADRWKAPFVWSAVMLASPLLALLPADIDVVIFRRAGAPRSAG